MRRRYWGGDVQLGGIEVDRMLVTYVLLQEQQEFTQDLCMFARIEGHADIGLVHQDVRHFQDENKYLALQDFSREAAGAVGNGLADMFHAANDRAEMNQRDADHRILQDAQEVGGWEGTFLPQRLPQEFFRELQQESPGTGRGAL